MLGQGCTLFLLGIAGNRGGITVILEEKKAWAEAVLREKAKELGRLPRKGDLDSVTCSRIKAFLGPWPRALEAAGLKEPRAAKERTEEK